MNITLISRVFLGVAILMASRLLIDTLLRIPLSRFSQRRLQSGQGVHEQQVRRSLCGSVRNKHELLDQKSHS